MEINGVRIQHDASGQGHAWRDATDDTLPASILAEIECEIIDGGLEEGDVYRASNGQDYCWVRYGDLMDYHTAEHIRAATKAERDASLAAAEQDGGAGVIDVDGRSCYVSD